MPYIFHHQSEAEYRLIQSIFDQQSCNITRWIRTFSWVAESFLNVSIQYFKIFAMDLFPVRSKSSSKLQIYYLCRVQNAFFIPHIRFLSNQIVLRVYGILHYSHLPSYILCSSMVLNVKGHLFALFERRGRVENTCISKIAVIYFITSRLK